MFAASIDLLVLRRLLVAALAVPLALSGLPGCAGGQSEEEQEQEEEEEEEEEKEEEKSPVCGDNVCDEGETSACSDCEEPAVCGDGICQEGETNACSDCAAPATGATLVVENYSSYSVWYFYMAPCSSSSWGDDLLGSNVLPAGYSADMSDIPPGCYDLRAETEGHAYYWETFGNYFNAGETYSWSLTN